MAIVNKDIDDPMAIHIPFAIFLTQVSIFLEQLTMLFTRHSLYVLLNCTFYYSRLYKTPRVAFKSKFG